MKNVCQSDCMSMNVHVSLVSVDKAHVSVDKAHALSTDTSDSQL